MGRRSAGEHVGGARGEDLDPLGLLRLVGRKEDDNLWNSYLEGEVGDWGGALVGEGGIDIHHIGIGGVRTGIQVDQKAVLLIRDILGV